MKKHTQSPYESSKVSYKPSGIEWLGEIPHHWEVRRLKYLVKRIIGGGTPDTSNLQYWANDENEGYLWVSIEDITNADFITDTKRYINQSGLANSSAKLLPPFSILYSIYASLGKIAYSNKTLATNQAILGIQPNELLFYKFLFYYLQNTTNHIISFSNTTTQNNISLFIVANHKIPLPPLQEQKEIAEFLDKKCEKIQNYINKKQKLITLLQEKKQALINEAVCGRVACHTERSEVSTTAYKPSGIEYLGLIPHHWEVKKLKHICKINPQANETLPNNFVYIDLESVIKGQLLKEQVINKEQAPSRAQRILQKQDILFQLVRPYQRNNYIFNKNGDYVASTGYAQIRTKECVNFVYYALLENSFVERVILKSTGSNYPAITSNDFADLKIPLPPLQEQKQIANFLDEKCEKINSVIEKTKKQIELVKEYKNTLINEAVCGRINFLEGILNE
ncbi:restriction endonuclease subunit S [Campylobacter upsaliensis]|nr:restriction endonuclease subunit S [Campylobacter upsaliensis]